MWYLIMLVGLYLIVPIMKVIIEKPGLRKAFMLLAVALTFVVPSVLDLLQQSKAGGILKPPIIGAIFRAFKNVQEDLDFHMTIGFVAYFAIGYLLVHSVDMMFQSGSIIGCFCLLTGVALTFFEIMLSNSKEAAGAFLQYYQVGILLQSSGMVLMMKALQGKKGVHWLRKIR